MPHVQTREEIQGILSALLLTRKEAPKIGVPIPLLERDYKEQEGTRIPYARLGYPTLTEFLKSLTDGLTIKYQNGTYYAFPIITEKTKHVSSLVAGQRSKKPCRGGRKSFRSSPFYPKVYQPPVRLDSRILAGVVKLVNDNPRGIPVSVALEYARIRLNYDLQSHDLTTQLRAISHEVIVEGDTIYSACSYRQRQKSRDRESSTKKREPREETVRSGADDREMKPAGYSDDEFQDDWNEYYSGLKPPRREDSKGKTEQPTSFGNLSDVYVDTKGYDSKSNETSEEYDDKYESVLINERTKIRLRKLIEKHPDGIWCADLPALYQKEYTIPLNYEEYGFSSVIDFAAHLPEIFHNVRPRAQGDFKLYDAKTGVPDIKQGERPKVPSLASLHNIYEQYVEPTEPIPTVLSKSTVEKLVPEGVMSIRETVGQICVTELDRGVHEFLEVIVVDVFTPSFFWIQLRKRLSKFNSFMTQLHEFYEIHAKKYAMPVAVMEKGMNCACLYADRWHRGIVKNIGIGSDVTIMFYDYGTVKSYSTDCIYFLHRQFSNLPAQAIACGLYNVKPTDGTRWSRSIACEFVASVSNVALVATVAAVDTENNSMLVGLTNTQGEEDFHINDWMVQCGFAVYGKMVRMRPPNYPFRRFLECKFLESAESGKGFSSNDGKRIDLNRPKIISNDSEKTENFDKPRFYDSLLKLHRNSRNPMNSSNISIVERKCETKENSSHDENFHSTESAEENIVKGNLISHDDSKTFFASGKSFSSGLSKEFYKRHSGSQGSWNGSYIDDTFFDKKKEIPVVESTRISWSSNEYKKDICEKNNYEISSSGEEEINSESFKNEERVSRILSETFSLHFKENSKSNENLPEFGTLRSRLGGHGRMEPIDWSQARTSDVKNDEPMNETLTIEKNSTEISESVKKFSESKESAIKAESTKESSDNENLENNEKNGISDCPKFPKAKRALWEIVKNNSAKKNENLTENNYVEKLPDKLKNETAKNSEIEKKLESSKFANAYDENNDLEPVEWNELRRRVKNPEKNIKQLQPQANFKSGNGNVEKLSAILPKSDESFTKIIQRVVSSNPTNPDSLFVPEGNIKMGSDATLWLRMLEKKLKKRRSERMKLFVPNNVLELLKGENDQVENCQNSSTTFSTESIDSADSSKMKNPSDEKIRKKKKLYDFLKERLAERENTFLESSSESPNFQNSIRLSDSVEGKIEKSSSLEKNIETKAENKDLTNENVHSPEMTNDWLQNLFFKAKKIQLSKLMDYRSISNDDSELDSDDLSTNEEIKTDENEESMNAKKISNESENNSKKSGIENSMEKKSDKDSTATDNENRKEEELGEEKNNEKKMEIQVEELSFNLKKNYPKSIPVFDDVNGKFDDENDDEWDYSPGWYDPEIPKESNDGATIEEILETNEIASEEIPAIETISSGDESSLELSENNGIETSPNATSRKESDSDSDTTEKSYLNISKKLKLFKKMSATLDDCNFDDLSIPIDEKNQSNEIIEKIKCSKNHYPILSEIKKSNIFKANKSLVTLDGDSSGEKSDNSYKNIFSNILKKYT